MNGFNLLAANEVDKNIIQTNILNHSKYAAEDKFILGDVADDDVKERIYSACDGNQVDVILGGPPCQGFSYAGWRNPDDTRNQLFREFVSVVRALRPKFFVMENVLGILTMRSGETIMDIIHAFSDEGYHVGTPLKLNSMHYTFDEFYRMMTERGLAHFVIPDLIRDPVVFCHVVCMKVYSSGSRVKHGMTATDRLDWERVNSLFIRVFEIFARK